uniref:Uncharacterized protein n=2 Tax=Neisseria meningitidis TaxID=487 RepID=C6SIM3_NEIME|nr:hypothetical protein predicted by Glimmer/Critica [Neisseria meningitidis alpha275]CCA44060.1 hypothetical protein NMALPHA522_0519 [Neisseria meningitidis alpha522]
MVLRAELFKLLFKNLHYDVNIPELKPEPTQHQTIK